MSERVINKVTSTSTNLPPVLLDLTGDTVNERNLERDQTAHNSGGQKITGQMAIEDAEAWARGTRNGTPVPPTDETYQNNSLYYSIVSGSIMRMAGQQAIAAATSATNAANSATAAAASENNAKASETASANSAVVSGSCMNIAGVHAGDAEAWAIGKRNGQLVPPTDPTYENNSLHYKEVCESIAGSLASVLKPKGTCLFVNLPTIADSQPGDTWNIEDEFTTTSDFREGAGRLVEAGANVYLTIDNKWDVLAGTTSDYIGATASTAAVHGLLPAAQAGDQDKVFKGDGKWHELDAVPSALIENAIAPIENSNIATNNYVRGAQFIKDNYLFKAKTDISAGDTLILDDNYEYAQEITDQIYETNVNINRNVQNLIAQIEYESTAENAYDVGDQFVYGGVLCKAIAAINQGDTFTLGTNYQYAYDITTQIKAMANAVANPIEAIVNVYGSKNLLPNNAVTLVINGITFTVNADGSVSLSGTATAQASIEYGQITLPAGTYTYTDETTPSNQTYFMNVEEVGATGNINLVDLPYTWTASYTATFVFRLYVRSGQNVDGVTFKPMIRDPRITDPTYVPYAMTNRELTENVIIRSSTNITPASGVSVLSGAYVKRIGNLINIYGLFTITPTKNQYNDIADLPTGFYDAGTRNCVFLNATDNVAMRGRIHGKALQIYPVNATMTSSTINVVVNECIVI